MSSTLLDSHPHRLCRRRRFDIRNTVMSFSDVPPVKPPQSLLTVMRQGCHDARLASGIGLNQEAIDRFLLDVLPASPSQEQLDSWLASGFRLPLNYPSLHAELNVISHLCMLNSLSGYRVAMHKALGQGAHKTIVQTILALYLADPAGDSSRPLSAETLVALTPMVLLDLLGLPTHEEHAHPSMPAIITGTRRRDELYEALETLCVAANDTGKRLMEMKSPDLGVFVERSVREASKEGKTDEEKAALFASKLITALPAFNDAYTFPDGSVVHIHKRALLLLSWLHAAFLSRGDPTMHDKLPLPSPAVLPAFVDNVIPSLLVYFGVLDLGEAKEDGLRRWSATLQQQKQEPAAQEANEQTVQPGPTLTKEEAYRVRAASVDACHVLAKRAHQLGPQHDRPWLTNMTEALIDGFLWTQAKRPDLTIVPRMVEKKTFMY